MQRDYAMSVTEIPTAIIGFGLAGRVFHAPLIQATEGLQLVTAGTRRRDQLPAGVRAATAEDIIADPLVRLLVIASPNDTHFQLAEAALRAGKDVVVDKPFTVSAEQAERLIEIGREAKRMLTVFHNRRWDSDLLTVRKLLASGVLGEIALFEAQWDRFRPEVADRWREEPAPGAGLSYDLGPHLIDQALLLFGAPQAVSADIACQRDGARVDDYFDVTLHYGTMRARLSASSLVAEPRPRFAIHGTGGSFVKYGLDPQEDALKGVGDPLDPGFGTEAAAAHGTLTRGDGSREAVASERGDYLGFYRGVVAALRDGAPPPVAPEDALTGLRIIELARTSSAEGRRLPLQPPC